MYEHVLAVVDGSQQAHRAVETASALAHEHHARLTIAAVVEPEHPGRHCAYGSSSWNDVLREAAERDLDRAWRLAEMPVGREIFYGKPVESVVEGARALGCDVIVVPGRHRGLAKLLERDRTPELRRRVDCEVIQSR